MYIRKYYSEDCKELTELFYETIHNVNIKDYTKEQVDVWATGHEDLQKWDKIMTESCAVVAVENDRIIGFGNMEQSGYLDRLYVHKDYQGRGVATAICDELEGKSHAPGFVTHASITAKTFFEKRGYQAVKEQQVLRQGVYLTNYVMEKK